ncbi:hypothetical protein SLEP1_g20514 [Rubroshorea leprosula]|uniref:SHSP domain-containing protein n=1 Tax=Rubroshorea leprosula TaxID=152421 RepID=A0AAV5JAI4_9ROSI|nr:hypothetical protein SLEP1_g20514 [Rubroshorea leprosula]
MDKTRGENNRPEPETPPVLIVAPLNSIPYTGPPLHDNVSSTKKETEAETIGPAIIFLPSHSTRNELDAMMATTQSGVALTGSAAMGNVGPLLGSVDIAESYDAYYFRVSLPGVSKDEKYFSCDVEPDGTILIKGITTTGEKIVCKHSQVFQMQTQNFCPTGHFSVSFQLPGPVNHPQFTSHFADGILEGIVKKR